MLFLTDIDDCAGQPCENGATCIDAVNNYTCNCVDGYTGKNCSIGKNSVSVSEDILLFQLNVSVVVTGYVESFSLLQRFLFVCQLTAVISCPVSPLYIFELKENNFANFPSKIFLNFSLITADIDDCVGQPCENGGTCIDAVNDYTCNCVDGYAGKNCSIGKNRVCLFQNLAGI